MVWYVVTDGQTETQSRKKKKNYSKSYNKLEQDRNNPIETDTELEMRKIPYHQKGNPSFLVLELIKLGMLLLRKRIQNYRYKIAKTLTRALEEACASEEP